MLAASTALVLASPPQHKCETTGRPDGACRGAPPVARSDTAASHGPAPEPAEAGPNSRGAAPGTQWQAGCRVEPSGRVAEVHEEQLKCSGSWANPRKQCRDFHCPQHLLQAAKILLEYFAQAHSLESRDLLRATQQEQEFKASIRKEHHQRLAKLFELEEIQQEDWEVSFPNTERLAQASLMTVFLRCFETGASGTGVQLTNLLDGRQFPLTDHHMYETLWEAMEQHAAELAREAGMGRGTASTAEVAARLKDSKQKERAARKVHHFLQKVRDIAGGHRDLRSLGELCTAFWKARQACRGTPWGKAPWPARFDRACHWAVGIFPDAHVPCWLVLCSGSVSSGLHSFLGVLELLAAGTLSADDEIWREGCAHRVSVQRFFSSFAGHVHTPASLPAASTPRETGREAPLPRVGSKGPAALMHQASLERQQRALLWELRRRKAEETRHMIGVQREAFQVCGSRLRGLIDDLPASGEQQGGGAKLQKESQQRAVTGNEVQAVESAAAGHERSLGSASPQSHPLDTSATQSRESESTHWATAVLPLKLESGIDERQMQGVAMAASSQTAKGPEFKSQHSLFQSSSATAGNSPGPKSSSKDTLASKTSSPAKAQKAKSKIVQTPAGSSTRQVASPSGKKAKKCRFASDLARLKARVTTVEQRVAEAAMAKQTVSPPASGKKRKQAGAPTAVPSPKKRRKAKQTQPKTQDSTILAGTSDKEAEAKRQRVKSPASKAKASATKVKATAKRKRSPEPAAAVEPAAECARCMDYNTHKRLKAAAQEAAKKSQKQKASSGRSPGANGSQAVSPPTESQRALRCRQRAAVKGIAISEGLAWMQLKARTKSLKFGRSSVHAWGLFAETDILPEEFLIEYVGEIIPTSLEDVREKMYEKEGLDSSYLFRIDKDWVIDATKKGGMARYVNHSCNPNCYTKIMTVEGRKHVVIFSKRAIQAGEELCYDYNFAFEADNEPIPCLCGAKNCSGRLN